MTSVAVERCLGEAEQCRQMAGQSSSPSDMEAWVRLEAAWIKLAQVSEERSSTRETLDSVRDYLENNLISESANG
jgi:hypothetical protein